MSPFPSLTNTMLQNTDHNELRGGHEGLLVPVHKPFRLRDTSVSALELVTPRKQHDRRRPTLPGTCSHATDPFNLAPVRLCRSTLTIPTQVAKKRWDTASKLKPPISLLSQGTSKTLFRRQSRPRHQERWR